ncbi:hypothetical protein B484DRAFT_439520, partial [Ochromonadaceae sp. CCMP2298]
MDNQIAAEVLLIQASEVVAALLPENHVDQDILAALQQVRSSGANAQVFQEFQAHLFEFSARTVDMDLSSLSFTPLPEVAALSDEIVANRRWFHAHPELSFQEVHTAAKIVEILRSYGIEEIFEGVARTGVVALIRGASEGPCVALRADIDALPVLETAEVEYVSQNSNVMHACGHDGHITGLLAAAKVLWEQRQTLRG